MPKRKPLILFTMVLAIISLLAAGEVLAQGSDVPTSCETDSGWTIQRASGPTPVAGGCLYDPEGPGAPYTIQCYRTDYWICQPGSVPDPENGCNAGGLGQLLFAVKTCSPDEIRFFATDTFDPADIYPPGVGDPTLGFLDGYLQAYVIRIEPNLSTGRFSLITDTPFTDLTTVALKAGKGRKAVEEYCEVAGLECPRARSEAGGSSSQCMIVQETTAGTIYMKVQRGPDGCSVDEEAIRFYINDPECDTTDTCTSTNLANGCEYPGPVQNCDDELPDEDIPICIDPPEDGFQFCADFGGGCQECFEIGRGSPICNKYTTSSGTTIKSCFTADGSTCSWRKCCKLKQGGAACGY